MDGLVTEDDDAQQDEEFQKLEGEWPPLSGVEGGESLFHGADEGDQEQEVAELQPWDEEVLWSRVWTLVGTTPAAESCFPMVRVSSSAVSGWGTVASVQELAVLVLASSVVAVITAVME